MFKIFFWLTVFFSSSPIPSLFAAKSVGSVQEAMGKTFILHEGEKKQNPLLVKAPVFLKDIVETGKGSALKLRFQDKTSLILREKTKIVVTEFLTKQSIYEVIQGKIKAVVTKRGTEFKTATAVVGVRGTEIAIEVSKKKTKVYCLKGRLNVFNPKFPQKIFRVAAGQFTDVLFGKLPTLPIPIPDAVLEELENQFGFPTSLESATQRGIDAIKRKIPGL